MVWMLCKSLNKIMVEFLIQVIYEFCLYEIIKLHYYSTRFMHMKKIELINVKVDYSLAVKQVLYYNLTKVNIYILVLFILPCILTRCSCKAE